MQNNRLHFCSPECCISPVRWTCGRPGWPGERRLHESPGLTVADRAGVLPLTLEWTWRVVAEAFGTAVTRGSAHRGSCSQVVGIGFIMPVAILSGHLRRWWGAYRVWCGTPHAAIACVLGTSDLGPPGATVVLKSLFATLLVADFGTPPSGG